MIATIKEKQGHEHFCSNCMMKQQVLAPVCKFCGAVFSNYEEMALEVYRLLFEEEIKHGNATMYDTKVG